MKKIGKTNGKKKLPRLEGKQRERENWREGVKEQDEKAKKGRYEEDKRERDTERREKGEEERLRMKGRRRKKG